MTAIQADGPIKFVSYSATLLASYSIVSEPCRICLLGRDEGLD